jgi:ABC-type Mn2+/Zn2+ transport system permease subunit
VAGVVLIFVLIVAAIFAMRRYFVEWIDKREANVRGFEVKLITGMLPVEQRKDNDHG